MSDNGTKERAEDAIIKADAYTLTYSPQEPSKATSIKKMLRNASLLHTLQVNWGTNPEDWLPAGRQLSSSNPADWDQDLLDSLAELASISGGADHHLAIRIINEVIKKRLRSRRSGTKSYEPTVEDIKAAAESYSSMFNSASSSSGDDRVEEQESNPASAAQAAGRNIKSTTAPTLPGNRPIARDGYAAAHAKQNNKLSTSNTGFLESSSGTEIDVPTVDYARGEVQAPEKDRPTPTESKGRAQHKAVPKKTSQNISAKQRKDGPVAGSKVTSTAYINATKQVQEKVTGKSVKSKASNAKLDGWTSRPVTRAQAKKQLEENVQLENNSQPSKSFAYTVFNAAVDRAYANMGIKGAAFGQPELGPTIMRPEVASKGRNWANESLGAFFKTLPKLRSVAYAAENTTSLVTLESHFEARAADIFKHPQLKATEILKLNGVLPILARIVTKHGYTSLVAFQSLLEAKLRNVESGNYRTLAGNATITLELIYAKQLEKEVGRQIESISEILKTHRGNNERKVVVLKLPSSRLGAIADARDAQMPNDNMPWPSQPRHPRATTTESQGPADTPVFGRTKKPGGSTVDQAKTADHHGAPPHLAGTSQRAREVIVIPDDEDDSESSSSSSHRSESEENSDMPDHSKEHVQSTSDRDSKQLPEDCSNTAPDYEEDWVSTSSASNSEHSNNTPDQSGDGRGEGEEEDGQTSDGPRGTRRRRQDSEPLTSTKRRPVKRQRVFISIDDRVIQYTVAEARQNPNAACELTRTIDSIKNANFIGKQMLAAQEEAAEWDAKRIREIIEGPSNEDARAATRKTVVVEAIEKAKERKEAAVQRKRLGAQILNGLQERRAKQVEAAHEEEKSAFKQQLDAKARQLVEMSTTHREEVKHMRESHQEEMKRVKKDCQDELDRMVGHHRDIINSMMRRKPSSGYQSRERRL